MKTKTAACARCGGTNSFGPGPLRTSAHPNSSMVLVETPGSHFHDINVQARVCLDCGGVSLELSPTTLDALRRDKVALEAEAAGEARRARPARKSAAKGRAKAAKPKAPGKRSR